MKLFLLSGLLLLGVSHLTFAQSDSIVFKNGNTIVGEIKQMEKGVMIVKTDYSDSDFKIEWDGVSELYSNTSFLITLEEGERYTGKIYTDSPEHMIIVLDEGLNIAADHMNIVYLKELHGDFWSKLSASIDLGYSFSKAKNLNQLSIRSKLGYLSKRWYLGASYDQTASTQDDVDPINRVDGTLTYRYFIKNDWYATANMTFLTNTEQKIELRTTGKPGLGKYIIHTNSSYWGFQGGLSFNNEKFSSDDPDKKSLEAFLGSELNLFNMGDISLLTNGTVYPSLTEARRVRFDFQFDFKYDLPLDFYIRLGYTLNYDNQPVEGAAPVDYVIQTTFGWEL